LAPVSSGRLVLLLALAVFINYVDRGNLATAAPLMGAEFKLSYTQLGMLGSAFFWSYVPLQVPFGWFADRYGAERVLGLGLAIWALATVLTGFASGFASLLALRLLLGVGESAAFPCVSELLARDVPIARLGAANGTVAFGYLAGPAVGTYLGAYVAGHFGWRWLFISFGLISSLWLWPWRRVIRGEARRPPVAEAAAGADFAQLLRTRALWGAGLGHFASNYTWYFVLFWLPTYLVHERGFSMQLMGEVAGAAFLVTAVSAFAMGSFSDRHIARGGSATVIYKVPLAAHQLGAMVAMVALAFGSLPLALAGLFLYQVLVGAASPAVYATAQIMAGPATAGRWVGIQNALGNVAGIAAPAITGILVDQNHNFTAALLVVALVNVLGLVGWLGIVPRIAPLSWQRMPARG
jgi:MFS family permease